MKKIILALAFFMTSCASILPYGENTETTDSYYYADSVSARRVYSCLQDELSSHGYFLEYGKLDNQYGINRFTIERDSEEVAYIEINIPGSSVDSQAYVKDSITRKDLDSVQARCVVMTRQHHSVLEGIIDGLKSGL